MSFMRSEPLVVGKAVSDSLFMFLVATSSCKRAWWEDLQAKAGDREPSTEEIDAVIENTRRRKMFIADGMFEAACSLENTNVSVVTALFIVQPVLHSWTLVRMNIDDAIPKGKELTGLAALTADAPNNPKGIGSLVDTEVVTTARKKASDLPAPVSTWALNAIDVVCSEGPSHAVLEAVFWLVEGSVRCAKGDEAARLAALYIHTGVALNEYKRHCKTWQEAVNEALPVSTKSREELIQSHLKKVPPEEHDSVRAAWEHHQCNTHCGHQRMDPRVALNHDAQYRSVMTAAYVALKSATARLRESLEGYAGQLGLHAIFPADEAGAVVTILNAIEKALECVEHQGFKRMPSQRANRQAMREQGNAPSETMRRVAITVAGIFSGIQPAHLASDVISLMRNTPIVHRACAAHWNMEHPRLEVGIRDLEALGVPAFDIDGVLRVLRAFVDRSECENTKEALLAAWEKFKTDKAIRQIERMEGTQAPHLRWRVTKFELRDVPGTVQPGGT